MFSDIRPLLVRAALLLVVLSFAPGAAGAQHMAPADTRATDDVDQQAAVRVAAAVCDKRIVLLGELPEHGEARGFAVKARIVEQLVQRCGFDAVLFEAGSYDFFGVEREIAARHTDSLDLALARAIGGFWWTRELAAWRRWLLGEAVAGRVAIGGIDDQPSATAAFARSTLPGLVGGAVPPARSGECRDAVARYLGWKYGASQPYDSTERARLAECTRLAAARAGGQRTPDDVMLTDIASYFARERANVERSSESPDRDSVMAGHVAWWAARLPRDAKIVVWTATTHAARTSGPRAALPRGVLPLGARLAAAWGDRLAAIGFTALQGEWARAGRASQPLAPLPPDALEASALTDGAEWAWLDGAALRALGPVPARLFGNVTSADWASAFDGVLVIRDEVAPTFEPRR